MLREIINVIYVILFRIDTALRYSELRTKFPVVYSSATCNNAQLISASPHDRQNFRKSVNNSFAMFNLRKIFDESERKKSIFKIYFCKHWRKISRVPYTPIHETNSGQFVLGNRLISIQPRTCYRWHRESAIRLPRVSQLPLAPETNGYTGGC